MRAAERVLVRLGFTAGVAGGVIGDGYFEMVMGSAVGGAWDYQAGGVLGGDAQSGIAIPTGSSNECCKE